MSKETDLELFAQLAELFVVRWHIRCKCGHEFGSHSAASGGCAGCKKCSVFVPNQTQWNEALETLKKDILSYAKAKKERQGQSANLALGPGPSLAQDPFTDMELFDELPPAES